VANGLWLLWKYSENECLMFFGEKNVIVPVTTFQYSKISMLSSGSMTSPKDEDNVTIQPDENT
jgi:hypothetical protein